MSVYILFFVIVNLLYSDFCFQLISRNSPLMPYETGEDFTDALIAVTWGVCVCV